jgi:hypothetical protein
LETLIPKKKVCNFVGGVVSPLLANLFLHYAVDRWMPKTYPHLPFARYAGDAIVGYPLKAGQLGVGQVR